MPVSFKSRKLFNKQSNLHGQGIFANEYISPDEIVWIRTGNVVTKAEANNIDLQLGDFSLQIEDDYFLSPASERGLDKTAIFFNHSCEPNVKIDGQITFRSIREIALGEELTVDFATIEARPDFRIICSCQSNLCRKKITGNDWLDPNLQARYRGSFASFIERKIVLLQNSDI